jgi:hypothetical protein
MNPDRENLLTALVSPAPAEALEQTRALIRDAGTTERAREWLPAFDPFLPAEVEAPLLEYLRYAVLGLCLGFVERDLSPFHQEHLAIVAPMLADIRSVFEQLAEMRRLPDPEQFRFRCFDYGVHKAYYLDWTLYMSKECY